MRTASGFKHFYVKDYLGSTRKVMKLDLNYANSAPNGVTRYAWRDGSLALASEDADYAPYNDRNIYADRIDRLGWLGKEKDLESGLGDHGVRKYDAGSGRFLSVDPLWEKYLSWTPYQYSANNPVNAVDVDGRKFDFGITDYHQQGNAVKHVNSVIDYLESGGVNSKSMAQNIKNIRDDENVVVFIRVTSHGNGENKFDTPNANTPRIEWMFNSAVVDNYGSKFSPAMVFVEEFSHFLQWFNLPNKKSFEKREYDEQFGEKEERRAKTIDVNPISKELEGVEWQDHKGTHYEVECPTCR